MECCVAFSDPRCFHPATMYGTTHAHTERSCVGHCFGVFTKWAAVLTLGTRPVGVTEMDHENAHTAQTLPNTAKGVTRSKSAKPLDEMWKNPGSPKRPPSPTLAEDVCPHVFCLLASLELEDTTFCLEIPLQSPRPWETVTWRPSPPPLPGDCRALGGEIPKGRGRGYVNCMGKAVLLWLQWYRRGVCVLYGEGAIVHAAVVQEGGIRWAVLPGHVCFANLRTGPSSEMLHLCSQTGDVLRTFDSGLLMPKISPNPAYRCVDSAQLLRTVDKLYMIMPWYSAVVQIGASSLSVCVCLRMC